MSLLLVSLTGPYTRNYCFPFTLFKFHLQSLSPKQFLSLFPYMLFAAFSYTKDIVCTDFDIFRDPNKTFSSAPALYPTDLILLCNCIYLQKSPLSNNFNLSFQLLKWIQCPLSIQIIKRWSVNTQQCSIFSYFYFKPLKNRVL